MVFTWWQSQEWTVHHLCRGNVYFLPVIEHLDCRHRSGWFFTARCMHSADYAVAICLSVHLSVCVSVCHTPASVLSYVYDRQHRNSNRCLSVSNTSLRLMTSNVPSQHHSAVDFLLLWLFDNHFIMYDTLECMQRWQWRCLLDYVRDAVSYHLIKT